MGGAARPKPLRLAGKLQRIRVALGYSQSEMLAALDLKDKSFRSIISGYEIGRREPPLSVLLKYARLAGVSTDVLIDDDIELPVKLPVPSKRK
jgi:transcriptional regulator with XRE-family HTH domain